MVTLASLLGFLMKNSKLLVGRKDIVLLAYTSQSCGAMESGSLTAFIICENFVFFCCFSTKCCLDFTSQDVSRIHLTSLF